MGISTIRSYRGAKIFEAVGLSEELSNAYFCLLYTSDATPIVEYTDKVVYLEDEEIALIRDVYKRQVFACRAVLM